LKIISIFSPEQWLNYVSIGKQVIFPIILVGLLSRDVS
jgi:hypothetical protein